MRVRFTGTETVVRTQGARLHYSQPVSFSLLMALDRSRMQPRNPAPCFLWIFLWFHMLMVMESVFPIYLEHRRKGQLQKENAPAQTFVLNDRQEVRALTVLPVCVCARERA